VNPSTSVEDISMEHMKIDHASLERFASEALRTSGVDAEEAKIVARIMVWADLVGRFSQGVWRLPTYLRRFESGSMRSPCNPDFIKKSEIMYVVDGHNGFGQYVGHLAMLKAIEIAGKHGVGMVGVRNSNHFGPGAYYVEMAAKDSKLGLAFTNAGRRVAPHGGIDGVLGTNPIAFGAPMRNGKSILVDLSTSESSGSMLRKAAEKGQKIRKGVLVDKSGKSVEDPNNAPQAALLPFGGAKGFCLGLMVEILSGVITGSSISPEIPSAHLQMEKSAKVGHQFIAIDFSKLMTVENYWDRMEALIGTVKNSSKQAGVDEILIPGETRWRTDQKQRTEGIDLDAKTIESLTSLAKNLKLSVPW